MESPATGAVTVTPLKLIAVTDVPTLLPDSFSSTPEITSVRLAPLPTKDVAVKIPLTFASPLTVSALVGVVLAIPTLSAVLFTVRVSPDRKLA